MKKSMVVVLLALAICLTLAPLALAATGNGTEFQTLYDRVIGWVTGLPAIIIAIGVAVIGVVRAFQSGGFMWAFGGILVAALIFLLPQITTGLGGCTF